MRCNLLCGLGLSILVLLAGLSLASFAAAQGGPATPSAHAELIKTLLQARRLLVHADHDYDGRRAKAVEEVDKALKELGHHHKKAQPAATPANGVVVPPTVAHAHQPKIHEPQGNSDAQLREAMQLIQGALTQMQGKHPKATANLNAAVVHLNTALKIK